MEEFRVTPPADDGLYHELTNRRNRFVIVPKLLDKPVRKEESFLIVPEEEQREGSQDNEFLISGNNDYQVILYNENLPQVNTAVPVSQEEVSGDFRFTSMLGTPLVMPVKIDGYQLPNEPLITITGDKKIIRTALNGANSAGRVQHRGSVKELISVNDYQVKITGRLMHEPVYSGTHTNARPYPNAYPSQEMRELIRIYESRRSVKIDCALTQLFGIEYIAISRVSFPGEAGMHNNQRYEITGYSDEDYEIDLASRV